MQIFREEKGSTLMLVVITVAILSLLGTALLSMSLMNVNMKYNDLRIKKSQYYAESGIDQVYTYIGTLVAENIEEAISLTDTRVSDMIIMINDGIEEYENYPYDADPTNDNHDITQTTNYLTFFPYIDETSPGSGIYILDTVQLEEDSNDWYKEFFKQQMNAREEGPVDETFKSKIETASATFADINIAGSGAAPMVVTVGDRNTFSLIEDDSVFRINDIVVEYTDTTGTLKTISTDVVVSADITEFPISTIENRIVLPDNPLWQKPLVANGYITFSGSTVEINGDVYGYAQQPGTLVAISSIEGVKSSDGANVTIDGNIYSRGHVQVANGASRLTVNNGLIYANSLVTQRSATNGRITVNGNVYTLDDIELNGSLSDITINGSFYGYSDGSQVGGATHDKSSAIVINEDMVEETLTITGALPVGTFVDYSEELGVTTYEGIMIGGTAYVDIADRYQTSESVSLRRNFIAYTWAFDEDAVNSLTDVASSHFVGDRYDFFDSILGSDGRNVAINDMLDDLTWDDVEESPGLRLATPTKISDRMLYFASFDMFVDQGAGFLNTGSGNINLSDYIYTTGIQLYNDEFRFDQRQSYGAGDFGLSQFNLLSSEIMKDYVYQLNQMRHSEAVDRLEDVESVNGQVPYDEDGDYVSSYNINTVNPVYKYSRIEDINSTPELVITTEQTALIGGGDAAQIKYINYESANEVEIIGSGAVPSGTRSYVIDLSGADINGDVQGIIISNSDIHIYGDITMAGSIISSGNIITHGGNIRIDNNSTLVRDYLQNMLHYDVATNMYNLFDVDSYGGAYADVVTLEDIESVQIVEGSKVDSTSTNSIYDYRDIVYFEHWKIVR